MGNETFKHQLRRGVKQAHIDFCCCCCHFMLVHLGNISMVSVKVCVNDIHTMPDFMCNVIWYLTIQEQVML